jgi:hypothetical protein
MVTRNAEAVRQAVRVSWASVRMMHWQVRSNLPRYLLRHRIGGRLDVLLCGTKEDITELYGFHGHLWQYSSLQQRQLNGAPPGLTATCSDTATVTRNSN